MLRAILFDFDGIIALSEPLHFAAFAEVLGARGVALSERAYYAHYVALTDRECLERMLEDFHRPDLRSAASILLREKSEALASRLAQGVALCPGVAEFVAVAAERAPLAIVSGALRPEIVGVLARAGLERFFSIIVSAEEVRAGKPDPEPYRVALERLRATVASDLAASECLVLEDAPKGILAARAAGMRVIALPHTFPEKELRGADRVAASYAALDWRVILELFR